MSEKILEKISHYQHILWDWNGTLINDADIGAEAEAIIFARYGLPRQTREERLRNFFMPIEKYYEKMGFDFSKISYAQVSEEWLIEYERLAQTVFLFDGVSEMLEELHKAGKRQYVLSAAPEALLHEMTTKHEIHHYFEAVYGLPDNLAASKIARGHELMKDLEIDAGSAILIGDTTHDFEVGTALDIDVLLVGDGHHSADTLKKVHHNVLDTRHGR